MRYFYKLTMTGRIVFLGLNALILALIFIVPAASATSSECEISLQVRGNTQIKDYQGLANRDHLEPIRIVARNNGHHDCSGTLTLAPDTGDGQMRGPDGAVIAYSVVGQSDINRRLYDSASASSRPIQIHLPAKSSRAVEPRLLVRRHQGGISGTYRARLDVTFQKSGQSQALARAQVKLSTHIKPSVQANFTGVSYTGGSKGGAHLKLGEITPGLRKTLGLQLRSNTDVDVEVSSYNHGRLTKPRAEAGDPSIGYHLTVSGQAISLDGKSNITLPAGISRQGQTSAVALQVEQFGDMPAGHYGDVILFRISGR